MAEKNRRVSIATLTVITAGWSLVVAGVLIYQAVTYTGLFAFLAEWQFARWNALFPVATIALITFLLSLPFLVLILWRLQRQRRHYGRATPAATITRDKQILKWLLGAAAGLFLIGAILAGAAMSIGGFADRGPTVISASAPPPDDASWVRIRGAMLNDRVGYYQERFVIAGRELYVVPIAASGDATSIRYFAEVEPRQSGGEITNDAFEGILRRASLPGGLQTLYENEGLSLTQPTYVIFRDRPSARWPYLSAAGDLSLLGLLCLLCFGLFRLRLKRLEKAVESP